jgi:hypothetical protein
MRTRNTVTCGGVGNHQLAYQCTLWRTRNTCVVPVRAAITKHLTMHVAYALSFDTTEGFWCFHIPLRACGASTYHYAHTQHLQRGGQSPISRSVHAMAHTQHLHSTSGRCNHQAFDNACCLCAQLDTTEGFWWFHIPLCAHATLAGGWASPSIISL